MAAITSFHDSVKELIKALGLKQEHIYHIQLTIGVDDVVRLEVGSLVEDKQLRKMTKVLTQYEWMEKSSGVIDEEYFNNS